MILATDSSGLFGLAIPLVVVFGLFIVRPLTGYRGHRHAGPPYIGGLGADAAATQTQILDELRAIRARLDEVERMLSTVD